MGSLGMGMGMGVSIIGGTPVLMPVAKMMEAASASSRGDRRSSNSGRLDDRDRHNGGGGGRWGREDGEDRWAGDSPSEDDLDRAGGRSEAHSRRRDIGDGGSASHRSRADSRDEGTAQAQASPQEEEPEEGELVIESSAPAVLPSPSPSPRGRKSRWGNVESEAPSLGVGGSGVRPGYASPRTDRWPSRDGGERLIGDGGNGEKMSTQGAVY